jgi:ribose 5-phosphate isomerase A
MAEDQAPLREDEVSRYKRQAAEHAVRSVRSDMTVGLGTGSTAIFAVRDIARRLASGQIDNIIAFATSNAVREEARMLGIPMMPEEMPHSIDVTIDGADEVDSEMNLIKGGGGALLREKIVAQASRRVIVIVDDSKLSPQLGTRFPVPVEVLPFGWRSQARYIESLGATVVLRLKADGSTFATDSGNMILDCAFGPIPDLAALAASLSSRAGIVEHGLFLGLATDLVIAGKDGVLHLKRKT